MPIALGMSETRDLTSLKAILPVTALLALAAAMPATAAAGGPIAKSRSTVVRGAPGSSKTLTVRCPRGTDAVAGGYRLSNHISEQGQTSALLPYESLRAGPRRWRVSAYKVGPATTAERLTAVAKCRPRGAPLRVGLARSTVTNFGGGTSEDGVFSLASSTASCPAGTRPLSGGFRISINGAAAAARADGPPVAGVFGSRASGRGWEITAVRLWPGEMRIKSLAYCGAQRILRRSRRFRHEADGVAHAFSSPSCPGRAAALAGGFYSRFVNNPSGGGGIDIAATFPISSGPKGKRLWRLTGYPVGDIPSPITTYVYCAAASRKGHARG
jgi:hypothetical protein